MPQHDHDAGDVEESYADYEATQIADPGEGVLDLRSTFVGVRPPEGSDAAVVRSGERPSWVYLVVPNAHA